MNYFKLFWIVVLGSIVSGILGFILWLVLLIGFAGSLSLSEEVTLSAESILKIELNETFSEAPQTNPFAQLNFSTMEMVPSLTLLDALTAIEAATTDDNIEAIYLHISPMSSVSTAALEEIRSALALFKEKSGKPIIAYNDIYTQSGYYLSSVADKLYVEPEGMMFWQGMASSTMFYKGLLDKLDMSVEVFRPSTCRFKSAVEPYILDKMSPANRAQMEQLLGSMWGVIAGDVALSRGLTLDQVNSIADNLECMDVELALERGMVDGLIYEDQLPALFREAGAQINGDDNKVNYISFSDYIFSLGEPLSSYGAEKVAIIYAEGSIVDGNGSDNKVYGDATAATIRKARYDESIKAVVLRVNSPGGSALASDVMWRELELLRKEKPLIVSMGSYAASGGYYISAPADVIVADRLTITGSIGVFSVMFDVESALQNNLGITFDGVQTNTSAGFMSSLKSLTDFERKMMVQNVDKVYSRFTSLVAQGRNLPLEKVLEIAQGRVWSGSEAVELGLADSIGGLKEAVAIAGNKAGLEEYRIVEMSEELTGLAAILSGVSAKAQSLLNISNPLNLKEVDSAHQALEPLFSKDGMVMYSPYKVKL
ncbi:MAG: signal peptide peptidase SppA [Rikenellaceae bacterium]